MCSTDNVLHQITAENTIELSLKTTHESGMKSFIVFVYQDSFRHYLLGSCYIEVYSYETARISLRAGQEKIQRLEFLGDTARTFDIYSSNWNVAKAALKEKKFFRVVPGQKVPIDVAVKTYSTQP